MSPVCARLVYSKSQPSITISPEFCRSAVRTPRSPHPQQFKIALAIDTSSLRITADTAHVDITDPETKVDLRNGDTNITAVASGDHGPGAVMLSIGGRFKQVLRFSVLSDTSAPKLRLARKSSWVEVGFAVAVPRPSTDHYFPRLYARFLRRAPISCTTSPSCEITMG